ncbi:MAG: hypothetical protein ACKO45_08160 [Cyanobium sp.]
MPRLVIVAAVAGVLANLKEISGWFVSPGRSPRPRAEAAIEPMDPRQDQRNRRIMLDKVRATRSLR